MEETAQDRPIQRLDDELIGKIAAGEVVENPASAVKELVENSLDAGATHVTVELRDGGIAYLRVTDNGHGIRSRDIRLAFERHATSKIRKTDDLFDLHTLGFRGEALASIAAVTKLTLTTRHAQEETGTRAVCEGGVFRFIEQAASPQGTTIVARELFYNTPVRRKFLKKPVTEATKVSEIIARLILSRPDVSFRLIHNGKLLYQSSGNGDLRSAVFSLYGRETAQGMTAVRTEGSIGVTGLVGTGALSRANRSRQTFIVNGRAIRSPLLTQALEEACRERFTVGHYPICVLKIDMPPGMVDVNVHPNKLEVRFSDEHLVFESVRGAVADSFGASLLAGAPSVALSAPSEPPAQQLPETSVTVIDTTTDEGMKKAREALQGTQQEEKPSAPDAAQPEAKPQQETSEAQQTAFKSLVTQYFGGAALRESVIEGRRPENIGFKPLEPASQKERAKEEASASAAAPAASQPRSEQQSVLGEQGQGTALAGYSMVGVAFDTYIILQNGKQLLFIDQHAAHERILYERLMREIDTGSISQLLLAPILVQVTPQDAAKIEEYAEDIRAAGYDVAPFGDNAYQLRAVPNVLGEPQGKAAFLETVDRLGELRVLATSQKRRDAILQMACKKAVKGGDKLTMEEIRPLLADMVATGAAPTCPHGRPLVVVLTRSELEKRFRRINN